MCFALLVPVGEHRRAGEQVTTQDTSALLVVDMQNDFLAQGGYYAEKAARVHAAEGELSAADHEALARVYLHPPATCQIRGRYQEFVRTVTEVAAAVLNSGMTTIFVQASYDPEARYRPPLFLRDPQRRDYACHPGTWGADLVEPIRQLASHPRARIVEKHTFDAFFETELRGLLRFKHIDTVYIAGVETNVCVLFTACSALSNGFNTAILVECVTTSEIDVHDQTLQIIEIAQGRLMSTRDFLTLLER
jgi:ureidoacrylate peracid hydrolase